MLHIARTFSIRFALLLAGGVVVAVPATSALAITFFDDFNRPDGAVGNGWFESGANVGGGLVIKNDALTVNATGGEYGLYRPINMSGPITVSATVTALNGFGGLQDHYSSWFMLGTDGNNFLENGYGIYISRSDQNFSNSNIALDYNGEIIDQQNSTFQFHGPISVSFTMQADNSIGGSVTDGVNVFDFDFGARPVTFPGSEFEIIQAGPDPRASTYTFPTIDNLSITYAQEPISPIGQLNSTFYDFTTTAFSERTLTCLAAVYTMIARTVGVLHDDPNLAQTAIDYFWTDPGGAYWWKHHNSVLRSAVVFIDKAGPILPGHAIPITASIRFGAIEGKDLANWLAGGGLAIIKIRTPSSRGLENHFMLATDINGSVIHADDSWTGTKVGIDISDSLGRVVEIMDPADGTYYPYDDLLHHQLPANVIRDFHTMTSQLPSGSLLTLASRVARRRGWRRRIWSRRTAWACRWFRQESA